MVNLLLNTYCNNNCPYCFATKEVDIKKSNGIIKEQITIKNAKYVANFFKEQKRIGILGGEPTLHPKFNEIVDIFLKQNYHVTIFTNGLFNQKILDYIKSRPQKNIGLLFNINHPNIQGPKRWELLNYNLKELYDFYNKQPHFSIGINIFSLNQDLEYILDTAKKYNVKRIRWDIAHPIIRQTNSHIALEDYNIIAPRIKDFIKKCLKNKISFSPDCGSSAPCMFSKNDLKEMYSYGIQKLFDTCTMGGAIDIGINLDVWRCFPLSQFYKKNLKEFNNANEIFSYFHEQYKPYYYNFFPMDKCYDCPYAIRKECIGTCLSRSITKNILRENNILKNIYFPTIKNIKNKELVFNISNKVIQKKLQELSPQNQIVNQNKTTEKLIITDLVHNFDIQKNINLATNKEYFPTKIKLFANFINSKEPTKYNSIRKTRNVKKEDLLLENSIFLKNIQLGFDDMLFSKSISTSLSQESTYLVIYYEAIYNNNIIFSSLNDFSWIIPFHGKHDIKINFFNQKPTENNQIKYIIENENIKASKTN